MSFRCLSLSLLLLAGVIAVPAQTAGPLRVCADPNNMPLSDHAEEGLENRLAQLVASKLGTSVQYTWWSQRKSFIKNSLDQNKCDVLMGVPSSLDSVSVTRPYYRSSYVFVSRRNRNLDISSLLDARLAGWRVGINVVGDDYAPPAGALARQGMTQNIVPFSLFGAPVDSGTTRQIIDAVDRGDIDIAIVWGPIAGYFGKFAKSPLAIQPVSPAAFAGIPFAFDMSMAVRKGDDELKSKLNVIIQAESSSIEQILSFYGVPQVR